MSSDFVVELPREDKMRRFLSRRPSLRLLAAPILLLAAFTVVGLMTDWIDWSTNKNCSLDKSSSSSSNLIRQRSGSSSLRQQTDESLANRVSSDWRQDSDQAYAKSMNESSFSSSSQAGAVCRSVAASQADIDTMQVYPTLNFQVGIDSGFFPFFFFHDQSQHLEAKTRIFLLLLFLQIFDVDCKNNIDSFDCLFTCFLFFK